MNITKIKIKKDHTVICTTETVEGAISESQTSYYVPLPDVFENHFHILRSCVADLLCLQDWEPMEMAKIGGISFTYNAEQGFGAVITALVKINGLNSPLVINTPHVCEISESGFSLMPGIMYSQLNKMIEDTKKFIETNKDIQGDLLKQD